jgi:hypothetical protein
MSKEYSWLRGFSSIMFEPHQTGLKGNPEPLKSIVFAGILETAATLFITWLHRQSPALIEENIAMMQPWMKNATSDQKPTLTSLPFDQALLSTLTISFIGIMSFGFVLWIIHWALTKESKKLYEITGIAAYGSAIYAIGTVVTGLAAYAFGSLQWGPHLGIFINPTEHPFQYAIFARMNIVYFASYAASAYAMIGASHIEARYGKIASIIAILIVLLWFTLFTSIGAWYTS